jgi:hypothetical protein
MSAPDIPDHYTINSIMSGGLDLDLDEIRIKEIAPITIQPLSLTSDSKLTSNSKVDMGLDNIRIKELPKIELFVEMAMKPVRVHAPGKWNWALSVMGIEVLGFCMAGESMVVVENYVPHKTELCV